MIDSSEACRTQQIQLPHCFLHVSTGQNACGENCCTTDQDCVDFTCVTACGGEWTKIHWQEYEANSHSVSSKHMCFLLICRGQEALRQHLHS